LRPLLFALVWSGTISACVAMLTLGRGEALSGRSVAVIAVFFVGSFLGAWMSWGIARLLTWRRRRRSARFAAMVVCLSVLTASLTAFLFFLQLRGYYASSHTHELSVRMLWEQVFTGATTAYIFGVMGARVLLPFMLLPLFAASWYFARIEPGGRV
jgi:magnesium-transporting ATPase (P-type)